eukprot:scaffold137063_cov72-Phaeocystis_antarctica.AAC.5
MVSPAARLQARELEHDAAQLALALPHGRKQLLPLLVEVADHREVGARLAVLLVPVLPPGC